VHAPWALAIETGLRRTRGIDAHAIWSDDGIALRLNEALDGPLDDVLFPRADDVEGMVVDGLGGSALFATHFRENAARALLLPRRRAGLRTPLWQMRKRAADLMAVAGRYGSFPIVLETFRECLQDVFDLPALIEVLQEIEQRAIHVVSAQTEVASPFAGSLLFDYVAEFMYDGDAPRAERRAQALALDRERLRELLGEEKLRELLDPDALETIERELQGLADRRARSADQVHDLLRRVGDLTETEVNLRTDAGFGATWLADLERTHRATRVDFAGQGRWVAIEDVARYRDGAGVQPPDDVPEVFLGEAVDALDGLLARWARTHAPFAAHEPAQRWGMPVAPVRDALRRLAERGIVQEGAFRPGGEGREWCDPDVLRSIRRRSLARLRREVEPVPASALGRFLPLWQGVGSDRAGLDGLLDAIAQLEGTFVPWSILEHGVLARRVRGYVPRLLDNLCASGEVVWIGRGAPGSDDGRVALFRREQLPLLAPRRSDEHPLDDLHERIQAHLQERGASFFREIVHAASPATDAAVLAHLWDLVWSGRVTNDTLTPLRLRARPARGSRRPPRLTRAGPPEAAGRWSLLPAAASPGRRAETERTHALVRALLDRHGVLTREAVLAEGVPGGFSAVYPVLKALEEAGKVRRGYFVEGPGPAQFALPPAVERLRAERDVEQRRPMAVALAAADPANPFGAALPGPRREGAERRSFSRSAGAYVVLVDGDLALHLDRGGKRLSTLPPCDDAARARAAVAALADVASLMPRHELAIEQVDGESAMTSPLRPVLEAAGFRREYLDLVLRHDPSPTTFGRASRPAASRILR
jgi:ATP-dependent Lhr-like helicase